MAVYKQPWPEVEADIIANSRGGDLAYELDEARQMWDMDSTPVAPQTRRETISEAMNNSTNKKLPAAVGAAGVGALGATSTAAATAAAAKAAALTGTITPHGIAYSGHGLGAPLSSSAAAAPFAAGATAALPLFMGLTSMPSGKANRERLEDIRADKMKARITPIDAAERDSRLSPVAPIVQAQADIYSSDEGDKDYQMDEAYNYNQSDAGKEEFADFRNTGDNSLYYNDDATRTDYAGEGNPTLDVQRQVAINTYGNSAAPDLTPAPAPKLALRPARPMAPAKPTPTMQAFQAAQLRKAAAPIDFTPSQAVSGYQSGGYTGGTSNG
tara:strand:+ start:374 stop:1354 length:981 start_codon:yes stop_codon:yes gene_type:complete